MNLFKKNLMLLYRSFDESLDEKRKHRLEKALEKSSELRKEESYIKSQRNLISNSHSSSFQPSFTEKVIEQINAIESKSNGLDLQLFYDSLVSVFRKVAIAGAIGSIAILLLSPGFNDILRLEAIFGMPDFTLMEILSIF